MPMCLCAYVPICLYAYMAPRLRISRSRANGGQGASCSSCEIVEQGSYGNVVVVFDLEASSQFQPPRLMFRSRNSSPGWKTDESTQEPGRTTNLQSPTNQEFQSLKRLARGFGPSNVRPYPGWAECAQEGEQERSKVHTQG